MTAHVVHSLFLATPTTADDPARVQLQDQLLRTTAASNLDGFDHSDTSVWADAGYTPQVLAALIDLAEQMLATRSGLCAPGERGHPAAPADLDSTMQRLMRAVEPLLAEPNKREAAWEWVTVICCAPTAEMARKALTAATMALGSGLSMLVGADRMTWARLGEPNAAWAWAGGFTAAEAAEHLAGEPDAPLHWRLTAVLRGFLAPPPLATEGCSTEVRAVRRVALEAVAG